MAFKTEISLQLCASSPSASLSVLLTFFWFGRAKVTLSNQTLMGLQQKQHCICVTMFTHHTTTND